ncbi:hypothetical protein C0J52_04333 [Blattella germanica]|nr:hypothetical protein C0J52_04333 [Blattella germanica]
MKWLLYNQNHLEKKWDVDAMMKAVEVVLNKEMGVLKASKAFKVPRMPRTNPIYTTKEARKRWKEEDTEITNIAVRENKMGTLKASNTFSVPRTTLQALTSAIEVEKTCNSPSQNPQPSTSSTEQSVHPPSPAPQQLQSTSKPFLSSQNVPSIEVASLQVITGTPYKQALTASMEASALTNSKKKLKFDDNQERKNNREISKAQSGQASTSGTSKTRRRPKHILESSESEDKVADMEPLLNDESYFEMPTGDYPKGKYANCLFCDGLFCEASVEYGHTVNVQVQILNITFVIFVNSHTNIFKKVPIWEGSAAALLVVHFLSGSQRQFEDNSPNLDVAQFECRMQLNLHTTQGVTALTVYSGRCMSESGGRSSRLQRRSYPLKTWSFGGAPQ